MFDYNQSQLSLLKLNRPRKDSGGGGSFFLDCEDFGRMFDHSFPASVKKKKKNGGLLTTAIRLGKVVNYLPVYGHYLHMSSRATVKIRVEACIYRRKVRPSLGLISEM